MALEPTSESPPGRLARSLTSTRLTRWSFQRAISELSARPPLAADLSTVLCSSLVHSATALPLLVLCICLFVCACCTCCTSTAKLCPHPSNADSSTASNLTPVSVGGAELSRRRGGNVLLQSARVRQVTSPSAHTFHLALPLETPVAVPQP
ncbi:hypothetical protein EJ04DRAFT_96696 [Polyplosphaeria fusca]|uniref:Uncharacterized protein n=1 Tax=Polyplosphaeria fusca TaxID=682080 RepID=A0A9P4QP91_9PLEO|nr:hypothetical protein EJ04DRAFT_96696 [Polyplosphaeria fusca]